MEDLAIDYNDDVSFKIIIVNIINFYFKRNYQIWYLS